MGRVREEKRREEERRSEKRKSQRKEDAGARKSRKVATHCACPMTCGSGSSKSRPAEAAGAEPSGQMRDEKLHAVVARSTCPSQNVQNTPGSEHFWKLRCRKSVHGCGAKHIFTATCTKCTRFGALLEVEMSKKGTQLWREAHLEVEMSLRMACVRNYAPCQKLLKGEGFVPVSTTTTTTTPHHTTTTTTTTTTLRYTN